MTRSRTRRQLGYAVAVVLSVVLLFVVNVWPTWRALPFVTNGAIQAVIILNVASFVAIVLNLLCFAVDTAWLKPLTEFINAVFAVVFSMEIWRSFPFDFPSDSVDWPLVTRIVIIAAVVGSVIGMIVQTALLTMRVVRAPTPRQGSDS
jgi:hypothetical protein